MTRPRPDALCPKCGFEYGFLHVKPSYHDPDRKDEDYGFHLLGEHLDWECDSCGYLVMTPVADA